MTSNKSSDSGIQWGVQNPVSPIDTLQKNDPLNLHDMRLYQKCICAIFNDIKNKSGVFLKIQFARQLADFPVNLIL